MNKTSKCQYCNRFIGYSYKKKHEINCPKNPQNMGKFNGICQYCSQEGFFSKNSLAYHENRCLKNKNRKEWSFSNKKHSEKTKKKQAKSFKQLKDIKELDLCDISSRTISKILKRMKAQCQNCGWNKTTIDLHHIIPKQQGGTDKVTNLAPLCPSCHRLLHNNKLNIKLKSFVEIYGENWKNFYYSI